MSADKYPSIFSCQMATIVIYTMILLSQWKLLNCIIHAIPWFIKNIIIIGRYPQWLQLGNDPTVMMQVYYSLLKIGSLDNAIREFSLA